MLAIYLEAPFAAFRFFSAGWYRPTATFMAPSAAYGLLMNIARIETRLREESDSHDGSVPATLTRVGLPRMRIAVGAVEVDGVAAFPLVQSVFQQLHNYPVGASAGTPKAISMGNKNNITPVRREFLSDLRVVVCVVASSELEETIRCGLRGELNDGRYGVPFLGDNQFQIDRLEELQVVPPAYWYEIVSQESGSKLKLRATRMTAWIDRVDTSKTISHLYAPREQASTEIPEAAWTAIDPA